MVEFKKKFEEIISESSICWPDRTF